jgi:phosphatidylglycerophosphate synthase
VAVIYPDAAPPARRFFPLRPSDTPVRRFAVLAPLGVAAVGGLGALLFSDAGWVALLVGLGSFVAGVLAAAWQLRHHHPHARLGVANVVTLIRLALVSVLVIPLVADTPSPVAIVIVAIIALSLDGVDGWLARLQGLSSEFGARFDMEVDSAFALVLALLAVVVGGASPLVLLLGIPRYLFGLAGLGLPWLNGELPPRFSGKVVCVVQLIVLIAAQTPWFTGAIGTVLVVGTLMALVWSFGRDIRGLWRTRA